MTIVLPPPAGGWAETSAQQMIGERLSLEDQGVGRVTGATPRDDGAMIVTVEVPEEVAAWPPDTETKA